MKVTEYLVKHTPFSEKLPDDGTLVPKHVGVLKEFYTSECILLGA
jgi:hypothetical protein